MFGGMRKNKIPLQQKSSTPATVPAVSNDDKPQQRLQQVAAQQPPFPAFPTTVKPQREPFLYITNPKNYTV